MRRARKITKLLTVLAVLLVLVPTVAIPMIRRMETHHQFLLVHGMNGQANRVEVYWQEPSAEAEEGKNQKYPVIIYVHGMQKGDKPGGLVFVKSGILGSDAKRGYLSVAISLPGYGQSDGAPDFCGMASQKSLDAALTYIRQRPDVDPKRIGIVGISCGATVAGMVASRNKVAALVLISGFYDFKEMVQKWQTAKWKLPPGIKKELEHNIAMDGGIENSTALRSLLPHISHLTMPILMIAGGQDRIIDVGQSETLHRLLDGQGTPNIFILDGTANHHIPLKDWRKPEKDFLDARLSDSFRSPKH